MQRATVGLESAKSAMNWMLVFLVSPIILMALVVTITGFAFQTEKDDTKQKTGDRYVSSGLALGVIGIAAAVGAGFAMQTAS